MIGNLVYPLRNEIIRQTTIWNQESSSCRKLSNTTLHDNWKSKRCARFYKNRVISKPCHFRNAFLLTHSGWRLRTAGGDRILGLTWHDATAPPGRRSAAPGQGTGEEGEKVIRLRRTRLLWNHFPSRLDLWLIEEPAPRTHREDLRRRSSTGEHLVKKRSIIAGISFV